MRDHERTHLQDNIIKTKHVDCKQMNFGLKNHNMSITWHQSKTQKVT